MNLCNVTNDAEKESKEDESQQARSALSPNAIFVIPMFAVLLFNPKHCN